VDKIVEVPVRIPVPLRNEVAVPKYMVRVRLLSRVLGAAIIRALIPAPRCCQEKQVVVDKIVNQIKEVPVDRVVERVVEKVIEVDKVLSASRKFACLLASVPQSTLVPNPNAAIIAAVIQLLHDSFW
jgi:hypothetical protein